MSVCTFFGHRDCFGLDRALLHRIIEEMILQGVDTFYVGNQGDFDCAVYSSLKALREIYPHICVAAVLAYLPAKGDIEIPDSMYPEIEGHPKYAIERRNRWMLEKADHCLCYIDHTWGGAYKFARTAKRRNLTVINLGKTQL